MSTVSSIECTLINATRCEAEIREGNAGQFRRLKIYIEPAGGKYTLDVDVDATYREFAILFRRDSAAESSKLTVNKERRVLFLSSDDFHEYSEVRLQEGPDGGFFWRGTKCRDSTDQYREATRQISSKFDEALKSRDDLAVLYKGVRICRHQCEHLFLTYMEGIQKMEQLFSRFISDNVRIRDGSLTKLENTLDSLKHIVCDAKELLGSCATDVIKVALVVSLPRPPVEKDMEVYSDFNLVIREIEWYLDVIKYLIDPSGHANFEWNPTMCRYELKKRPVDAQEKAPDQGKARSFACVDREELQSGLQNGSIVLANTVHDIILKRCKAEVLQGRLVDPEIFKIDHLDLDQCTLLGEGTFKKVYEGNWYGQSVAIATIRMDDPDTLPTRSKVFRDEVERLLQVQHPKVVSLFGWAETTDAPEPVKKSGDKNCVQGGYIVTEKMECTLDDLIKDKKRDGSRKSSGPFPHSVEIDILLQIVEAMLHVQNCGVMHRDLKPGNFLVNFRSSPPGADTYYNVKLIDFGNSKVYLGDDGNTYNMGTTSYGAPEMMVSSEKEAGHGNYGPPVDVFSFAMTCYQVITGLKPYRNTNPEKAIRERRRPEFPLTVLQAVKELTEECWSHDPRKRPSFEEIQKRLWTIKMKLVLEECWDPSPKERKTYNLLLAWRQWMCVWPEN